MSPMPLVDDVRRLWARGGATLIAGRALRVVADELLALSAPGAFRERTATLTEIDDAVAFTTGPAHFQHYDLRVLARQVPEEITSFLRELAVDPPRRVLEIGTCEGGTLFLFTRVAAPDATLVSIDLPGRGYEVGYPARKKRLYRSFAREQQTVRLVRRDSHDAETAATVERLVGGALDLLFIDGDHSYAGVRRDFDLYSRLVRPGGVVALHDIVPGPPSRVGGVPTFWSELKTRFPDCREYVRDWSQPGYGIGVVRTDVGAR